MHSKLSEFLLFLSTVCGTCRHTKVRPRDQIPLRNHTAMCTRDTHTALWEVSQVR